MDSFGVGTRLNVSADAPSLDLVYKLVRYGDRDVLKLSTGKESWVGPKAVHRFVGADARFERDRLSAADEPVPPDAVSLLEPVMAEGDVLRPHPSPAEIRARAAAQVAALPEPVRRLSCAGEYPVEISPVLRARQAAARAGR